MQRKRFTTALTTLFFILTSTLTVFADDPGDPCAIPDPDNPCPLDSWVFVLVIAAILFSCFHLYRRSQTTQTV